MFAVLDVAVEEMLVLSTFGTSGGTVSIACPSKEDAMVDQSVVSLFAASFVQFIKPYPIVLR